MQAKYDLTGQKFGRLTVISHSHRSEKNRSHHWNCQCECGKITKVCASSLRRTRQPIISCGCYRYEKTTGIAAKNRLDYGISNLKSLFHTYKKSAKDRNLEFTLSLEIFAQLTKQDCTFCGIAPSQIHKKSETYGDYLYNGIDRLDSSLGYNVDNCAACCKTCNYAKREMSSYEFLQWIKRVYSNFIYD